MSRFCTSILVFEHTRVVIRVGLNLNFEFESAHELLMNLNSTFAKSMNLNLVFSKSMNLNLVFSQSMNLNLEIQNKLNGSNQCRRYGGQRGPYSPNGRLCPHFGLLKILLLKHHATTRQQTMMEKGIIAFKHNYPLVFFRFFAKLLATNYCVLI